FTTPVVRRCPDGHFRRIIYDFGPFIADYPEQVMLAGIVQNWCATYVSFPYARLWQSFAGLRTNALLDTLLDEFPADVLWDEYEIDVDIVPFTRDFPRADIHEMLSPDLLHQIIKSSFKDHLVTWVGEYIYLAHSKAEADEIMVEIDRRYVKCRLLHPILHYLCGCFTVLPLCLNCFYLQICLCTEICPRSVS
ncbi:hypothetical protein B0H14DRAFT_2375670, partial [Mycena olivaceomarginata]